MVGTREEILHENLNDSMIERYGKDPLNELAIRGEVTWREAEVLEAYSAYMFQNKFKIHDQSFIKQTLIKHVAVTKLLIKHFHSLFDPANAGMGLAQSIQPMIDAIASESADEAFVLGKILEVINCTLRTNFYQKDHNGKFKDYFAFKLNTMAIKDAPRPLPYNGTLVYAKDMSGCHLRGGLVARGGLRWSEREDFRMEVLALMRAQKLKNSIIVPDGAKGGFILKNVNPNWSKAELLQVGIAAYKTLLRGLLDVTDNIVNGKIVKPKDVVCRDGDNPYLVVAADRGTGDFSDIANAISKEYNFWLGDAFASGGSTGYSHKKLAITSRGGWVACLEHFKAIGIDPDKDAFTVTGIGSMAGDVCGNGLLLSKNMKVLAAFSSSWIFIDPNPDLAKAFAERERLFALPDSNWIDYDTNLISKGGGVFSRKSDKIQLSAEMKKLFGLETDEISPDNLIKQILKLDVDLLWNGGIGTYVKAVSETNEQIMDKTTDSVRINANELRCKVVSEGGNLGFTQRARIEYSKAGGRINTDFIDNSGGVDCSDHEVNFKIMLNSALAKGKITEIERIKLLAGMTDFVVNSVLANSAAQSKALTYGEKASVESLAKYQELISILKERTDLDCAFEALPDDKELDERANKNMGLMRPELAILLSYSKRLACEILTRDWNKDIETSSVGVLLDYFPIELRERFKDEILSHPLRKEICVTKLANHLIDNEDIKAVCLYFHNHR